MLDGNWNTALNQILRLECIQNVPIKFIQRVFRIGWSAGSNAIAANTAWLMLDRVGRMIFSLILGVWTARYLGPIQFGQLYFVYAYLAFFQVAVSLGFNGVVVRDLATNSFNSGEILGTATLLRAVAGVVCWIVAVCGIGSAYGFKSRECILCVLAGCSLIFSAFDTIDLWFQSQSQSKRTIIPKLFAMLISSWLRFLLLCDSAPLYAFAGLLTVEAFFGSIGLVYSYKRANFGRSRRPWRINLGRASMLINESYPYLLSGLAITVYTRIDQIMIKSFLGFEASGLFAAALPLSTISYAIPTILTVSLAPIVAQKKRAGSQAYEELLLLIFRGFAIISILISIATAILAPLLISTFYGDRYVAASPILAIHVFCSFFVFQGTAQTLWMVNERRGHWALGQTLFGALVAIIANCMLIPICGLVGAALSAVMAQAAAAVLSNVVISREILAMQFGLRPKGTHVWLQ